MSQDRKRVVWFEGMTLDPHHFQQWDRYRQDVLNARLRAVAPNGWGLLEGVVDEERLANGEFSLLQCTAVMPDGLVVDLPGTSPVPEARSVQEHLASTQETVQVLLAVPDRRSGGRNVQLQGSNGTRDPRFIAESSNVEDENTGDNPRPVEVAHTNVQVRFDDESMQGYSTLPVAQITRTGNGFELAEEYVPPCVRIGASGRLTEMTRRMLELLVARSGELREHQQEAFAQRELSPSDIRSLNLMGTLNAYIPQLNQHLSDPNTHPKALLTTLTALAGELSSYVEDAPVQPRDLPTYDHEAPSEAFRQIETTLRQMLGEATPSSDYEHVELRRKRQNVLVGDMEAAQLENWQLFLVTRSEHHSENKLTNALPEMLRVASPNTIDDVLQSYTQALNVRPTRRLPVNMPVDNQATYFKMEKRGPFWDSICQEEGIAIFVPSDFQDMDVELIAVQ
jgi:type VI secretion system protein ImpJ